MTSAEGAGVAPRRLGVLRARAVGPLAGSLRALALFWRVPPPRPRIAGLENDGREWTDEETILALNLYVSRAPGRNSVPLADVKRLARVLRRTPASVGRKIGNLQSVDPAYVARGRVGLRRRSLRDEQIFSRWASAPSGLVARAQEIALEIEASLQGEADASGPRDPATAGRRLQELREALSSRLPGENTAECRSARRLAQDAFAEAVLLSYRLTRGDASWLRCPGCGHDRTRLSGGPLLEAHHLVSFAETGSQDPRWGVPLCCNCHDLAHRGPLTTRRAIFRALQSAYPRVADNLRALVASGAISAGHAAKLRAEGLEW